MAPIVVDGSVLTSWSVAVSLVISLSATVSLLLGVLLCCCCGKKKKTGGAETQYVSFDPRNPYFCEDCAMRAWETFYPGDPNPMHDPNWKETKGSQVPPRPSDYDLRLHYFNHGSGAGFKEPSPAATMRMKEEYQSVMQQNRSTAQQSYAGGGGGSPGRGGGGGGGFGGGGGEPTGFKSGRNPAYGTLYDAKSNVFERGGGKAGGGPAPTMMHGDAQMQAAQANPAYQTIWAAKSGVFDKPGGGGGGGGGAMGRSPQASMAGGPNETRMAAAAKNPAYQTLYDAKSGVFDRKGGGGGGMPVTKSAYRD